MQGICDEIRIKLGNEERRRERKGREKFERRVRRFERGFGDRSILNGV